MLAGQIPTRRDEAWRYGNIAAVEAAWPLPAAESIVVPAGGNFTRTGGAELALKLERDGYKELAA